MSDDLAPYVEELQHKIRELEIHMEEEIRARASNLLEIQLNAMQISDGDVVFVRFNAKKMNPDKICAYLVKQFPAARIIGIPMEIEVAKLPDERLVEILRQMEQPKSNLILPGPI